MPVRLPGYFVNVHPTGGAWAGGASRPRTPWIAEPQLGKRHQRASHGSKPPSRRTSPPTRATHAGQRHARPGIRHRPHAQAVALLNRLRAGFPYQTPVSNRRCASRRSQASGALSPPLPLSCALCALCFEPSSPYRSCSHSAGHAVVPTGSEPAMPAAPPAERPLAVPKTV